MRERTKGVIVGVIASVVSLATVVVLLFLAASPSSAFGLPWQHKNANASAQSVIVHGSVTCSSASDGFGAAPKALALSVDGRPLQTISYPFKVSPTSFPTILKPPQWAMYAARVTVPAGHKEVTLGWKLTCWSENGTTGATSGDAFTVSRKDLSRTICSKRAGYPQNCTGEQAFNWTGDCGVSLVPIDPAVSLLIDIATSPPKNVEGYLLGALGAVSSAVGIVESCWPPSDLNVQPAPQAPQPAAPLPQPNAQPVAPAVPVPTQAAPAHANASQPAPDARPAPATQSATPAAQPTSAQSPAPTNTTGVISYNRMQPGAPYYGRTTKAWQAFTSASNTITQVGVTWSDPNLTPGALLTGVTTRVSICTGVGTGADPCVGRIADGFATVRNQGESTATFQSVTVIPGGTYYVFYYQPAQYAGSWDVYWWSCPACTGVNRQDVNKSDQMQMVVRGYNR